MNKFEQVYYESENFWQEGAFDQYNQIRIRETSKLIPTNVKTLLDVGCGNGILCNYLNRNKKNIKAIGLDRSNAALKYVKTEKKQGNITNIPFNNNSFDCVSCLQVLEHLTHDDFELSLKELCRVSNKYIILSLPFNEKIEKNVTQCPSCKTIFNFNLHLRSFSKNDVIKLLDVNNFKCINTIILNSTYIHMGLTLLTKAKEILTNSKHIPDFYTPICPLCGLKNTNFMRVGFIKNKKQASTYKNKSTPKQRKSIIKELLKSILPKQGDKYWIISLYEKILK